MYLNTAEITHPTRAVKRVSVVKVRFLSQARRDGDSIIAQMFYFVKDQPPYMVVLSKNPPSSAPLVGDCISDCRLLIVEDDLLSDGCQSLITGHGSLATDR
jgi:hypothetical protein